MPATPLTNVDSTASGQASQQSHLLAQQVAVGLKAQLPWSSAVVYAEGKLARDCTATQSPGSKACVMQSRSATPQMHQSPGSPAPCVTAAGGSPAGIPVAGGKWGAEGYKLPSIVRCRSPDAEAPLGLDMEQATALHFTLSEGVKHLLNSNASSHDIKQFLQSSLSNPDTIRTAPAAEMCAQVCHFCSKHHPRPFESSIAHYGLQKIQCGRPLYINKG